MLMFRRKYLDAIRRGEKTQTLRIWKSLRVQAGKEDRIPGLGPIFIDAADKVSYSDLTDEDAIMDGFPSVEALKKEIEDIYGPKLIGNLYRIRFHLLDENHVQDTSDQKVTRECVNVPEAKLPVVSEIPSEVSNSSVSSFVRDMKENLIGTVKTKNNCTKNKKNISKTATDTNTHATEFLTEAEVVETLIRRCRINRNVCDWNHEPGKSKDFFALFLQAPRDEKGVPTLDGYRLRSLMRDRVAPEDWEPICWIAEEVCRAWTEWQYAVEHWNQ